MRYAIQEIDKDGMIKRNPIYEEIRLMMSLSTNPYNLPEESRYVYRLAKISPEDVRNLTLVLLILPAYFLQNMPIT